MKDCYNLFVALSLQQCTAADYSDKEKVKKHNVALRKIQQLQKEMAQKECYDELNLLLSHEDERVLLNAAVLSFQMGLFVEKAEVILKGIMDTSNDLTMCFSAKMLLQSMRK